MKRLGLWFVLLVLGQTVQADIIETQITLPTIWAQG